MAECRQQWDIPAPQLVVTEYRQIISTCRCGKAHAGEFPVMHGLCGAHLLRELNYFDEILQHQWPAQLKQVLIDAKTAVAQAKATQHTNLPPLNKGQNWNSVMTNG
ncbi:MAG: hypothetical protein WAR97_05925 [Thiothrix eikelboomii]